MIVCPPSNVINKVTVRKFPEVIIWVTFYKVAYAVISINLQVHLMLLRTTNQIFYVLYW